MLLPILSNLLSGEAVPKTLSKIIETVFGGGSSAKAIEEAFRSRLNAQEGRTAGNHLGHAICEQIDEGMETKPAGTDLAQRIQVGALLAKGAAVQLAEAAEILLKYPALQAAVVTEKAKSPPDAAALAKAREARDAGAERVKQALIDVGRVAAGDAPRDA